MLSIFIDLQAGAVVERWQHGGCEVFSPNKAVTTTKKMAMKRKAQKTSKQLTSTRTGEAKNPKPKAVKTKTTQKVSSGRKTREPKAQGAR